MHVPFARRIPIALKYRETIIFACTELLRSTLLRADAYSIFCDLPHSLDRVYRENREMHFLFGLLTASIRQKGGHMT